MICNSVPIDLYSIDDLKKATKTILKCAEECLNNVEDNVTFQLNCKDYEVACALKLAIEDLGFKTGLLVDCENKKKAYYLKLMWKLPKVQTGKVGLKN